MTPDEAQAAALSAAVHATLTMGSPTPFYAYVPERWPMLGLNAPRGSHVCPAAGCAAVCDYPFLLCREHFFSLPYHVRFHLKFVVRAEYAGRGQCEDWERWAQVAVAIIDRTPVRAKENIVAEPLNFIEQEVLRQMVDETPLATVKRILKAPAGGNMGTGVVLETEATLRECLRAKIEAGQLSAVLQYTPDEGFGFKEDV